jgi:hypothetical protein
MYYSRNFIMSYIYIILVFWETSYLNFETFWNDYSIITLMLILFCVVFV